MKDEPANVVNVSFRPETVNQREVHEVNVTREQAKSIAEVMTGKECWTAERRIWGRKYPTLYVSQGEGRAALIFEGSNWWLILRALRSFLKNRGLLKKPDEEGGEAVLV